MHKLIACTSYTASAGCSVSTLNIAYHLARNGSNVCVLDLDLASPTLGAAAGLADVAAGADPGIHHHLGGYIAPENISDIERDVWTSPHIRSSRHAGFGTFKLVLGTSGAGDFVLGARQAADLLGRVLGGWCQMGVWCAGVGGG